MSSENIYSLGCTDLLSAVVVEERWHVLLLACYLIRNHGLLLHALRMCARTYVCM